MFSWFINGIKNCIFVFLACSCNGGEWRSICGTPLVIVEFTYWIIHPFLLASQTIFQIKSLYVICLLIASINRFALWWIRHTHTKLVPEEPAILQHFVQNAQNLETLSLTLRYFSLKAGYISLGCIKQEVSFYEHLLQR